MICVRWIFIAGAVLCTSIATAGSTSTLGDTLLPADVAYRGYRLHVRKISVVKQRKEAYLLRFEAVNTGRRPISFGPGFPSHYLQTVFDASLGSGGLLPLGAPLRAKLSKSNLSFEVGEWQRDLELWVTPGEDERLVLKIDEFERVDNTITERTAPTSADADSEEDCVDLELSAVRTVFRSKSTATLQIELTNSGSSTLAYSEMPQGLELAFFLSGSPQLTASARRVGSLDLHSQLAKRTDAALAVGETTVVVHQISTEAVTRYTSVVVAQLDGGQLLLECNETNNERHLVLD